MTQRSDQNFPAGDPESTPLKRSRAVWANGKGQESKNESEMCYEVFRNNTTAVEVIVKAAKSSTMLRTDQDNVSLNSMHFDREPTAEFSQIDPKYDPVVASLRKVIWDLKSHIEVCNKRETDCQMENLGLRLENDKLKSLVETKSNLLVKLKKDFDNIKHALKMAVKGLNRMPKVTKYFDDLFDGEYEEFENSLKKDFDTISKETFDKSISRDTDSLTSPKKKI